MKIYKQITTEMIEQDLRYLELLSHKFPTIAAASTEIINLEAIVNMCSVTLQVPSSGKSTSYSGTPCVKLKKRKSVP